MTTELIVDTVPVSQSTPAVVVPLAAPCAGATADANPWSSDLLRIRMLLHAHTNHDFSQYKETTLLRGILDCMNQNGTTSTAVYANYREEHPEEIHLLFRKLLIPVTCFFRDPKAFAKLKKYLLAQLLCNKPRDSTFHAWVPACSKGEEAYSLAILLQEAMREARQTCDFNIFATDIDKEAVAEARIGSYPQRIARDAADLFTPVSRKWKLYRANPFGVAVNPSHPERSQGSEPASGSWLHEA